MVVTLVVNFRMIADGRRSALAHGAVGLVS